MAEQEGTQTIPVPFAFTRFQQSAVVLRRQTGKGENGTEKPLGRRVAQETRNINQSGRGRRHPLTAGTACEPARQRSEKADEKVPL